MGLVETASARRHAQPTPTAPVSSSVRPHSESADRKVAAWTVDHRRTKREISTAGHRMTVEPMARDLGTMATSTLTKALPFHRVRRTATASSAWTVLRAPQAASASAKDSEIRSASRHARPTLTVPTTLSVKTVASAGLQVAARTRGSLTSMKASQKRQNLARGRPPCLWSSCRGSCCCCRSLCRLACSPVSQRPPSPWLTRTIRGARGAGQRPLLIGVAAPLQLLELVEQHQA